MEGLFSEINHRTTGIRHIIIKQHTEVKMERQFEVEFLSDDRIRVVEKNYGDSAIFKYYDDDPELYMLSCRCSAVGMDLSLLEDMFETADNEIKIQQYQEDCEAAATAAKSRANRELEKLRSFTGGAQITGEEAFRFFYEQDLELLKGSPEEFFRPLNMEQKFPPDPNEYTGAQFFCPSEDAEARIPTALKKQVNDFYETEYSFRNGYPAILIGKPRAEHEEELSYYPCVRCGILFVDRAHVLGIIQFSRLNEHFADYWKCKRGPGALPLYRNEFGHTLLVMAFTLDDDDGIVAPRSSKWHSFFNTYPNLISREYNEFLRERGCVAKS